MKRTTVIFLIAGIAVVIAIFLMRPSSDYVMDGSSAPTATPRPGASIVVLSRTSSVVTPKPTASSTKFLNVPFIAQAPLANWSDPRQQNACEEASLLMAIGWITGEKFTPAQNEKRITDFADWQIEKYGFSTDTNADDTAKLMRDYLHYDKVRVVHDITVSDIKKELTKGNLVIVPANGQRIGNPNFTAPGPLTHMFPILGYDSVTDEFIVNDPGTRQGAGYRYSSSAVENALQDYPTGAVHGYQTPGKTAMIVVEK
jgi:hypothetical protein